MFRLGKVSTFFAPSLEYHFTDPFLFTDIEKVEDLFN